MRKRREPNAGSFKTQPLAERFWSKVDKRGPGECWEWTASVNRMTGYGAIRMVPRSMVHAHRVSFFLTHGRWPEPFCLHRCDNRRCVNPAHLFEGTNEDNLKDMARKGRSCRGERNAHSKLTAEKVRQLRASYVPRKVTYAMLAKRFGISETCVGKVIREEHWALTSDPEPTT